jgi:hypothetical protein
MYANFIGFLAHAQQKKNASRHRAGCPGGCGALKSSRAASSIQRGWNGAPSKQKIAYRASNISARCFRLHENFHALSRMSNYATFATAPDRARQETQNVDQPEPAGQCLSRRPRPLCAYSDGDLPLVKSVRRATLAAKSPVSGKYRLNFVAVRLNRTENRPKRPGNLVDVGLK